MAAIALTLGILSIIGFCVPFISPGIGALGLILAIVALGRIRSGRAGGRGLAIAGLITSAIGLLLGIAVIIALRPLMDDLRSCVDLPTQTQQQQCIDRIVNDRFGANR